MLHQQNDCLPVRVAPSPLSLGEAAWRHRLFLAVSLTASMGMGVFVYTLLPTVYQSTAQVLVWQKRPDAMLSVDNRNGVMEDTLATQQELLKSTVILERAIRERQLAELPSLRVGKEATDEVIRKELTVSRGKGSGGINNVLQVSYRGAAADECAVILAAVVESYKKFLDDKYQTFAGDTLELVLRERADLEKALARKEVAYQAFLEKSPWVPKKADGTDLSRDRLASIQTKRSALMLRRAELQSQLEGIESALRQGCSRETILALIAEFAHKGDEPEAGRAAAAMPDQLTPLLLEEQKLLERYGADHPEVRSVRKRITIARNLLVVPASAWDGHRRRGFRRSGATTRANSTAETSLRDGDGREAATIVRRRTRADAQAGALRNPGRGFPHRRHADAAILRRTQ